jgi:hypothetical protein
MCFYRNSSARKSWAAVNDHGPNRVEPDWPLELKVIEFVQSNAGVRRSHKNRGSGDDPGLGEEGKHAQAECRAYSPKEHRSDVHRHEPKQEMLAKRADERS